MNLSGKLNHGNNSIKPTPNFTGAKLFSKKGFSMKGKMMQKVTPLTTTSINSRNNNNIPVDISLLDFMGIEEFLAILKSKTANNNQALWTASCTLACQLKGSRALLSLGLYLSSNDGTMNVLDRLIDTAYFTLNAEHVFLLQLDKSDGRLVVTHTHADTAIGLRLNLSDVVSGTLHRN